MTEYDQQAMDFLAKFQLTFKAVRYPVEMQKAPAWVENGNSGSARTPHGYRYRIIIKREGHGYCIPLAFDFWGSIHDREKNKRPSAYDVLACISSDIHAPNDFKQFCDDFGYDSDSIKAKKTWKRVLKFAHKLHAFFTADELAALAEIQ